MLAMFKALPPYFGGKRKLVKQIFRHVPPPSEAPVFVDAFLGGGSVALYAKARGHRVIANDIADRAALVGRALIANSHVRLSDDDIRHLFVEHPANNRFVETHFVPDFFVAATRGSSTTRSPMPAPRSPRRSAISFCSSPSTSFCAGGPSATSTSRGSPRSSRARTTRGTSNSSAAASGGSSGARRSRSSA